MSTGVVYNPFTQNFDFVGTGGSGSGITTIDGDTGSITGTTVTIYADQAAINCGSSVQFVNSGTVSTLNLTDDNDNTILGSLAGVASNTASGCTGLGAAALASITDDDSHVAIGIGALQSANDATSNTAVGAYALNALTGSGDNTAIGAHSGISLVSGNFNTMVGYFSGTNYTSSESSNILIGSLGVAAENNTIRIGTQGTDPLEQNTCYIAGIVGVTTSNTNYVTIDTTTGQLGAVTAPTAIFTAYEVTGVTAGTYSMVAADQYLSCDSSGGTITIDLYASPDKGQFVLIKDSTGSAGTNNITITSGTIDGQSSLVLAGNYDAVQLVFNGTNWDIN